MRELNVSEVGVVSGAGIFSSLGKDIGKTVGKAVSQGTGTNYKAGITNLGQGVGQMVDGIINPKVVAGALSTTLGASQVVLKALTGI